MDQLVEHQNLSLFIQNFIAGEFDGLQSGENQQNDVDEESIRLLIVFDILFDWIHSDLVNYHVLVFVDLGGETLT